MFGPWHGHGHLWALSTAKVAASRDTRDRCAVGFIVAGAHRAGKGLGPRSPLPQRL